MNISLWLQKQAPDNFQGVFINFSEPRKVERRRFSLGGGDLQCFSTPFWLFHAISWHFMALKALKGIKMAEFQHVRPRGAPFQAKIANDL